MLLGLSGLNQDADVSVDAVVQPTADRLGLTEQPTKGPVKTGRVGPA